MPFARRDVAAVPSHWLLAGPRNSVLSNGPRKAITPAHAILNYLYAILEAETRLACLVLGLDPALGLVHSDHRTRHSLVLDLMEPVRPHVDAYVLELLRTKTFLRSDFFETRDGSCRVTPTLTEPLAMTALHWRERIGPVAERVAALCAAGTKELRSRHLPSETHAVVSGRYRTPLTRANQTRPLKAKRLTAVQERATLRALAPARCKDCGGAIAERQPQTVRRVSPGARRARVASSRSGPAPLCDRRARRAEQRRSTRQAPRGVDPARQAAAGVEGRAPGHARPAAVHGRNLAPHPEPQRSRADGGKRSLATSMQEYSPR